MGQWAVVFATSWASTRSGDKLKAAHDLALKEVLDLRVVEVTWRIKKKSLQDQFKKSPEDIEAGWNFLSDSLDEALKQEIADRVEEESSKKRGGIFEKQGFKGRQ